MWNMCHKVRAALKATFRHMFLNGLQYGAGRRTAISAAETLGREAEDIPAKGVRSMDTLLTAPRVCRARAHERER